MKPNEDRLKYIYIYITGVTTSTRPVSGEKHNSSGNLDFGYVLWENPKTDFAFLGEIQKRIMNP